MLDLARRNDTVSALIAELFIAADDVAFSQHRPQTQTLRSLPERLAHLNIHAPAALMFATALVHYATVCDERRWIWLGVLASLRPLAEAELDAAEAAQLSRHHLAARLS